MFIIHIKSSGTIGKVLTGMVLRMRVSFCLLWTIEPEDGRSKEVSTARSDSRGLKFAQRYLRREIDEPCGLGSSMFLALGTADGTCGALNF